MSNHVVVDIDDLQMPVLGKEQLIRNKRATGRLRDIDDADLLEGGSTR